MLAARKRLYMSYISLAAIDNIARAELFLFSPLVALFFFFLLFHLFFIAAWPCQSFLFLYGVLRTCITITMLAETGVDNAGSQAGARAS